MSDTTLPDDRIAGVRVSPLVPLGLLETLRTSDAPDHLMGDEDVRHSMPRRLGLSDAVNTQIRRYRDLQERRAWLGGREMADLVQLVGRRPDSADVFDETGQWLTRRTAASGRLGRLRAGLAALPLPASLRTRLALRTARGVAEKTNPGAGEVRTELDPPAVIVDGSFPAACDTPDACRMVAGALRAALSHHTAPDGEASARVVHPLCEARGDRCCVWRAEG